MARKKSSIGCLFYLALVLLVIIIFLFKWGTIREVIENTGFLNVFTENDNPDPINVVINPDEQSDEPTAEQEEKRIEKTTDIVLHVNEEKDKEKQEEKPVHTRRSRIFFVQVNSEGEIALKGVIRSVQYQDAPLKATLETLLQGPLAAEINQGLLTLLPHDTAINNISIKGDTAILDFNESFRFNSLGPEGALAQIKQVVFSATEFSNIKKVQILIEGKRTKYLSPEGIYIEKPLSRNSF
jgi:spore germination protein GerM